MLLHFWPLICLSDAPPDLEPHEDYEEDNFNFTAPENMDANDAPNLTKLSEVAIQELDYYNFGKDVGSYNTAWALIRLKLKYCWVSIELIGHLSAISWLLCMRTKTSILLLMDRWLSWFDSCCNYTDPVL